MGPNDGPDEHFPREDRSTNPVDGTSHGTSEGGWDVGPGTSSPSTNVVVREASFGDENAVPFGTAHNDVHQVNGGGGPSFEGVHLVEGSSLRPPLGELPPNMVYPFGHHIPYSHSTISHMRVWLPNSFPREPRPRKKAQKMAKQGAYG